MKHYLHVVDDEPEIVWALEQYFSKRNYNVVGSRNGHEALANLKNHPPALVILDVIMPGMNGLTVCEQMRNSPGLANIPILFLTARSDLSARLDGFGVGGDDYVTKPFDLKELEARVEALLRRYSLRCQPKSGILPDKGGWLLAENKRISLTPSEMALMSYLIDRSNQLVPSQDLLQQALKYPTGTGNLATVRFHIGNLRAKIKAARLDCLRIKTIDRSGYMLAVAANGNHEPPLLQ